MNFVYESHRNALELLEHNERYQVDWLSLKSVLENITDDQIIKYFDGNKNKSISVAINKILKEQLVLNGWNAESPIFQDVDYQDNAWRLDFAKGTIAVEVAFNHGSVIAWNLIKPNLSGELNHVSKAIQTDIGVIIAATANLKKSGGFDSAIGTYEKYLNYLKPLRQMLTVPILVIGLESPESFRVVNKKIMEIKLE